MRAGKYRFYPEDYRLFAPSRVFPGHCLDKNYRVRSDIKEYSQVQKDPGKTSLFFRASIAGDLIAKRLSHIADYLVKKSVWIFSGDDWAYDIGYSLTPKSIPIPAVRCQNQPREVPRPNSRPAAKKCRISSTISFSPQIPCKYH